MFIALLDVVAATLVLQRTLRGGDALLGFGILVMRQSSIDEFIGRLAAGMYYYLIENPYKM